MTQCKCTQDNDRFRAGETYICSPITQKTLQVGYRVWPKIDPGYIIFWNSEFNKYFEIEDSITAYYTDRAHSGLAALAK